MRALQELKTYVIVGFLLLAAAIGFIGYNKNDSTPSSNLGVQQKPQVIQIQKQPPVTTLPIQRATVYKTESRKQYVVQKGDTFWVIAQKKKPDNVEMYPYIDVFKKVNRGIKVLHVNKEVQLPNENDLKSVILPDVKIHFEILDQEIINHIKQAEGSKESQATLKRKLLGGVTGPSYKNSKFYPYKDMKGNYTIGYGHYLGKKDSDAIKYKHGITEREAQRMLVKDMKRTYDDFTLLLQRKNAVNLSKEQQRLLYEMAFTLGVDKLSTFEKMWTSVKHGNDVKFKKEIENSLWFRQVGKRAHILVDNL
ncbi:tail lysozyme [Salmonella phage SE_PL]|uniref:glycoside hydrolase family protein n=1 Tax=Salmonella enterica TaxID=28901 RepID=UPI000FDF801F|nr:tail lysozyme [Salmonella phage Munch]ECV9084135.1 hypothetical protein [Salmonella enterica subsp. enterica serovar Infantis]EME3783171.1 hypothetical protein [Salmonella enterica]QCW18901.1 hypothetical protein 7t3_0380 [Salmonella phage 7t3]QIG62826.1 tail lysozyme [Salmonella phage SE_PL]WNV47320.1 lysozyme [Klebsiella phage fENko-Kae01]